MFDFFHGVFTVKCRHNDKIIGKIKKNKKRAIFPKCLFKRACPFKSGRLLYTGVGKFLEIVIAQFLCLVIRQFLAKVEKTS